MSKRRAASVRVGGSSKLESRKSANEIKINIELIGASKSESSTIANEIEIEIETVQSGD